MRRSSLLLVQLRGISCRRLDAIQSRPSALGRGIDSPSRFGDPRLLWQTARAWPQELPVRFQLPYATTRYFLSSRPWLALHEVVFSRTPGFQLSRAQLGTLEVLTVRRKNAPTLYSFRLSSQEGRNFSV